MSSFDGESNFRDVVNNLDEENRDDYKRLNVLLPINEPGIDNISRMSELQESVRLNPQLMESCRKTLYALLIATFYFELDTLPTNPLGQFQCFGTIRCRLPGKVMVQLLGRIHSSHLTFETSSKTLGYYGGMSDLCSLCGPKPISSVMGIGCAPSLKRQGQIAIVRSDGQPATLGLVRPGLHGCSPSIQVAASQNPDRETSLSSRNLAHPFRHRIPSFAQLCLSTNNPFSGPAVTDWLQPPFTLDSLTATVPPTLNKLPSEII